MPDFTSMVLKATSQPPLQQEEELESIRVKLETLNKKSLSHIKRTIAQTHSDKLEMMRDLATYENNACESLDLQKYYKQAYENVSECLMQIKGHTNETQKFSENLFQNVESGVNKVEDLWVQMLHSNQLV